MIYINGFTRIASFGIRGKRFDKYITSIINEHGIGQIWDCNFNELIYNLHILKEQKYTIIKRKI